MNAQKTVERLNKLKGSSPREFWKGINKLCGTVKNDNNSEITLDALFNYYSKLFQTEINNEKNIQVQIVLTL